MHVPPNPSDMLCDCAFAGSHENSNRESSSTTQGLRAPVDFMPQPSSPSMLLSSGSFRHHYSDGHAVSQWAQESDGEPRAHIILLTGAELRLAIMNENENQPRIVLHDQSSISTISPSTSAVNTPTTPTTPTFITTFFMDISAKVSYYRYDTSDSVRSASWKTYIILIAVTSLLLLAVVLFGSRMEWMQAYTHAQGLLNMLKKVSEALEICLESAGFLIGRAVARFGRGFERGYHL
ncbi:hypothetical protein CC80DRAFT_541784 [Byssothecium circinans]|uniref:Uncharacterized protein n=1 Tax=Byssothecium circinans TaxID=147558 RepID=A0A6A5UFB7_9PLEO|nr:hypothetical protein CC80DRAFT_541784 [Byssothecium circinans]